MYKLVRLYTTLLVAAFFAVSSVAWAASGSSMQAPIAFASADHDDHHSSDAETVCVDAVVCSDMADHGHDADSTCCAFACQVVAVLACSAALNSGTQPRLHDVVDPTVLLGAVPVGPERPPRTA
ncbi:hypothetical protein [Methylobrevis pamukkalensis]|uniref:hypothetical protein n=1 Tax=Methylobrevis pamukkalensis TaxID=1439726 RepID=UPI00114CAF4E|nr:hypothetical protein [Methylobrevis pamukkalensis]